MPGGNEGRAREKGRGVEWEREGREGGWEREGGGGEKGGRERRREGGREGEKKEGREGGREGDTSSTVLRIPSSSKTYRIFYSIFEQCSDTTSVATSSQLPTEFRIQVVSGKITCPDREKSERKVSLVHVLNENKGKISDAVWCY